MFKEILSRIGACLSKHRLPYMIIGGQAVLLYGEPRLTRDIDVTLGVNIEHLQELLDVVRELSLKPIPESVESFVRETMVLPTLHQPSGIRVDFIFSFTLYEEEAIKRAREVRISGQSVSFASPEDVIIHKIFAGRPRDLEDVRSILLKTPDLDSTYIRTWLTEFDAASDRKEFLVTFDRIVEDAR